MFYNCTGLEKVTCDNIDFTSLGSLTSVLQGDGLSIGNNAFYQTGLGS